MSIKRLKPAARKDDILAAALPLAEVKGYENLTRNEVAQAAGVSGPTVMYHFGTVGALKAAIVRYAVEKESLRVVAQAVIAGVTFEEDLARRALGSLI